MDLTKDDKDPALIATLLNSAELLGRFVDLEIYLPFIQLDTVLGISNPAGSILLAGALLRGMPPSAAHENAMNFHEWFVPSDICESDDFDILHAVLELIRSILHRTNQADRDDMLKLAYTVAHLEAGFSHQSEEASISVAQVKGDLQHQMGLDALEYHHLMLPLLLDRFKDGSLNPLFLRSCNILCQAVEAVDRMELAVAEQVMQCTHPILKNGDRNREQLQRCLSIGLVLSKGDNAHIVPLFLQHLLTSLSSMPSDTLATLMDITDAFFEGESNPLELLLAEPVLRAIVVQALGRDGTDVCKQAHSFVKKYPSVKNDICAAATSLTTPSPDVHVEECGTHELVEKHAPAAGSKLRSIKGHAVESDSDDENTYGDCDLLNELD